MTRLVLDCSVSMAWCFEDEKTPGTQRVLHGLKVQPALVPAIWTIETSNTLLNAERRGRITKEKTKTYIESIRYLNIQLDQETHSRALHDIFQLARDHRLTAYDAAYLELAVRRKLPLATRDADLMAAANAAGVTLVEM